MNSTAEQPICCWRMQLVLQDCSTCVGVFMHRLTAPACNTLDGKLPCAVCQQHTLIFAASALSAAATRRRCAALMSFIAAFTCRNSKHPHQCSPNSVLYGRCEVPICAADASNVSSICAAATRPLQRGMQGAYTALCCPGLNDGLTLLQSVQSKEPMLQFNRPPWHLVQCH